MHQVEGRAIPAIARGLDVVEDLDEPEDRDSGGLHRPHSALGYLSPADYETIRHTAQAA